MPKDTKTRKDRKDLNIGNEGALNLTGYHSGKIRCTKTAARLLQTELEEPVKPSLLILAMSSTCRC